jgi:hypothetical protein
MIKFLTDKTVSLIRYGAGTIASLPREVEAALVEQGAAENFLVVSRPVEVLSGSAAPVASTWTGVDEVLASFTIPQGMLGVNSILQIEPLWTFTSSANSKICRVRVGGILVYSAARTTSTREAPLIILANRNSLGSQIQPYDAVYITAGSGTPATYAIDFSVTATVEIMGQRAAAGDALTLEYYRVLHFVAD